MSKVSVIMPAYNAGKFIKEAIESILAQTHQDWELLILDDASSDTTLEIISTFSDPRILIRSNAKNQGYLKSCNQLFELATGEYLTFLDADDTCPSNRLEKCISVIEENEVDFLSTDYSKFWDSGKSEDCHSEVDFDKLATDPDYYPTICCATIFVKTRLVKQIGGYHPVFNRMGAEDYHWLFRLSKAGKGIHYTDNLYRYRQHDNQIRKHQSPEHFIAHDLDKQIRTTLINSNVDLLSPDQSDQLSKLKSDLLLPFDNDSTLILRYQSIQILNEGNWGKAIATMCKAVSAAPLNMANWKRLTYLIYVVGRRSLQF